MTHPATLLGEDASPVAAPSAQGAHLGDALFILGMLTIPLEFVQIGPAQPGQLWMLVALPFVALSRKIHISRAETICFSIFALYVLSLMFIEGYPRVKAGEQAFKFLFLYPGFYYIGRGFGTFYTERCIPFGYKTLIALLIAEYLVQALHLPVLYQEVDFQQSVLHGTFKERNWIAMFFFLSSYYIFEFQSMKKATDVVVFLAFNAIVTLLSQSKTSIVACGIVVLTRSRLPIILKTFILLAGAYLYWQLFSGDLASDQLQDRLSEERGLAYDQSLLLISKNVFGYGFGYVEAYFSQLALVVQGLGEGTNSVFSVPLDLMIIAGGVGFAAWLVFFCGIGLGATTVLAPIAALSLLNPLHQSDIVYFFIGMLLSGNEHRRHRAAQAAVIAQVGK